MIQFWFLWVFITLVVVIVALTLRKEREEMPRKEILRAVETSASSMGLAEKSFLWAFSWLDTRFRIQDYWGMSRDAYYGMHRQMPMSHAEKYKLRIIWYWYPLYCLGGISFLAFSGFIIEELRLDPKEKVWCDPYLVSPLKSDFNCVFFLFSYS